MLSGWQEQANMLSLIYVFLPGEVTIAAEPGMPRSSFLARAIHFYDDDGRIMSHSHEDRSSWGGMPESNVSFGRFTFRGTPDPPRPRSLVIYDTTSETLKLPFEFHDVPLPR